MTLQSAGNCPPRPPAALRAALRAAFERQLAIIAEGLRNGTRDNTPLPDEVTRQQHILPALAEVAMTLPEQTALIEDELLGVLQLSEADAMAHLHRYGEHLEALQRAWQEQIELIFFAEIEAHAALVRAQCAAEMSAIERRAAARGDTEALAQMEAIKSGRAPTPLQRTVVSEAATAGAKATVDAGAPDILDAADRLYLLLSRHAQDLVRCRDEAEQADLEFVAAELALICATLDAYAAKRWPGGGNGR
jgi:hypothetical protein